MNEEEKRLQENIQRNLQVERQEYRKLNKIADKLEPNDFILGRPFNLVRKDTALFATGITAIPPTVMVAIAVPAGLLTIIAGYFYAASQGASLSGQEQHVINTIENFMNRAGTFSINTISLAAKTAVLPLSLGTVCFAKDLIEKVKSDKQDETLEKMYFIKDIINLLKDIKYKKDDPSLDFVKEFLSNVDLRGNSNEYNSYLLNRLVNYRNTCKAELEGTKHEKTTEQRMEELVELITDYELSHKASKKFLNNEYVRNLVTTYSKEEQSVKK